MAADRPLPTRVGRIRLDAPYFTRFAAQILRPTTLNWDPFDMRLPCKQALKLKTFSYVHPIDGNDGKDSVAVRAKSVTSMLDFS